MSPPPPPPALLLLFFLPLARSSCPSSPCTALASYMVTANQTLTYVASLFGSDATTETQLQPLFLPYNPSLTSINSIAADSPVNVPFSCACSDGASFPSADFSYKVLSGETYTTVAQKRYKNLTTAAWLEARNSYPDINIPDNAIINVTINCSCGDRGISMDYGLFVTYPLRENDTVLSVAKEFGFTSVDLLQSYNVGVNFSSGKGIVFVPTKDKNGSYHPLEPLSSSKQGISGGSIAGICVAAGVVLLVFVSLLLIYRRRERKNGLLQSGSQQEASTQHSETFPMNAITVEKSVEFSYEELATATDDFSIANKIGQGGFGAVYYAELRGERTAVKMMTMQSTKEFSAELNILARVHHLNLVRLVGYCVKDSLFLVYEYMDNGNLTQHLRGSARSPLPWATRVHIALDAARGLEYIHEHTVPVYIHRDIKSENILLDKNLHAKVADFGLAKLSEASGNSMSLSMQSTPTKDGTPQKIVGTFGYMPPEYAQYGEISSKVDVYAFGVVIYELISAKAAVIRTSMGVDETKGLVPMFEDAFNHPNPLEEVRKLVDPRLEDYPMDAVYKMAELGRACTQELPDLRPNMRNIVVKLMMLESQTGEWDIGHFRDGQMSGR